MLSVTRWNPVGDEVSRFFDEFLGVRRPEADGPALWRPRVDIEEDENRYQVRAELPGMKLEDIKITVADEQLTIRGEKRRVEEQKGTTYHRIERLYGTFERSFSLGHAVQSDRIEATYRDGVLEVTLPKADQAKAREIPIKVAK